MNTSFLTLSYTELSIVQETFSEITLWHTFYEPTYVPYDPYGLLSAHLEIMYTFK